MHFIICAILLTVAFAAPQDMDSEPSDAAAAYEATVAYEVPKEMTPSYDTPEYVDKVETTAAYEPKEETYETPEPTTVKPPVIEFVEGKLFDLTAGRPLHEHTAIISAGKELSKVLTAKIVAPVIIFNTKVATAAGALPPLLAAKGAIIGSAIATPIEIGALISSKVVTGVTGKLVAVPITLAAASASKLMESVDKGEQIVNFNLEHGGEILKDGLIKIGHIVLKPIAIVVGAQTALTGAGLGIAGTGIKGVGVGMEAVGAKLVATGLTAKGLGHRLIVKQFPPYFK